MKLQSNPLNSNSNQNRFFVVFVHTFTAILPSVTRTLDNSNLSLTGTNFHFPSSNFVDNFTLDKSNNVFQDEASKKIDIGYWPAGRSALGKTEPEVLDTQDNWVFKTEGIVFSILTDLGWWITILFFSTTQRKACERPEHWRAVIMARFETKWAISSEQIVMKTEIIQVEERRFTERFLFT